MTAKQTLKQRKALRSAAAKKPRRVRKQLGGGMSILVSREEAARPREMIAADIGCFRWGLDLEVRLEERMLLEPSIWQRIKRSFS